MTLNGQFNVKGRNILASLNKDYLSWNATDNSEPTETIYTDDILACQVLADGSGFEVVSVVHREKNKLEERSIIFHGSPDMVRIFSGRVHDSIQKCGRPRRLLVLINPNSGSKRANKKFNKHVRPIFNKCNVQLDVKVTSRAYEPSDILENYVLSHIDGIVCIGGDGFYCECMNGLIIRQQKENGVNIDDPTAPLVPPTIPIGIIPAGSGNYLVQYLHGTRCVKTAALKILLGKTLETNSASIHEDGHWVGYSGLVLGFGLFGDMMNDCEQYRWMGPKRYQVIPIATLMKRRTVDVEVEYLPVSSPEVGNKSRALMRQISVPVKQTLSRSEMKKRHASTTDLDKIIQTNEWQKTDGRVYAVDTHPVAMVAKDDRMQPKFGADSLTLTLTSKCSITKHIDQLTKVKEEKADCYQYDFLKQMDVEAYRVKLKNAPVTVHEGKKYLNKDFYINCDGEAIKLKHPEFEVRLHKRIISIYGVSSVS